VQRLGEATTRLSESQAAESARLPQRTRVPLQSRAAGCSRSARTGSPTRSTSWSRRSRRTIPQPRGFLATNRFARRA